MNPPDFRPGRVLRANGRYSITHLWRPGILELKTKCGLTYEASELYEGDEDDDGEPIDIFASGELPDGFANCGECFPGGNGSTVEPGRNQEQAAK